MSLHRSDGEEAADHALTHIIRSITMADTFQPSAGATISGSELQLLVQMLDGIGRDTRAGFERMDRKIGEMIPRPEFTAFQEAVSNDLKRGEEERRQSIAEHVTIRKELELCESKLETKIEAVEAKALLATNAVAAAESERLREFKTLNMKLWGALGGVCLTGMVSVAVAIAVAGLK
jgi:hypothetical protein